jgi:hypothetical protein
MAKAKKVIPDSAVEGTQVDANEVPCVPFRSCPECGEFAIVLLPLDIARTQTDGTTMVCDPRAGGCNLGFASPKVIWNEHPNRTHTNCG